MVKCKHENCTKQAKFGIKNGKTTHCSEHKTDTMVRKFKVCTINDCYTTGTYFGLDDKRYCAKHRPTKIRKTKNMCVIDSCNKQGTFMQDGDNKKYCSKHKLKESKDVVSKKCKKKNCNKNPCWGNEGEKPKYCKKHKKDGMIDVKNKKNHCIVENCNKQASYNYSHIKRGCYCKTHKKDEMIDVKHPKCLEKNCMIRPSFALNGSKVGLYCYKHKMADMIDVVSILCQHDGCTTQPSYGYIIKKPLFCKKHKEKDMVYVRSQCLFEGCITQPVYNFKRKKRPKYCNEHKKDGMVDIINPMCQGCGLFIVNKKKFCAYCNPNAKAKTREYEVVVYMEENFDKKFVHNKSTGNGVCGGKRPDILYDADTHFVIIEVDEDQHRQYEKSCEVSRMVDIYTSLGMRTIFIRYNPDVIRINGKVHKIFKKNRMKVLLEKVKECINTIPEKELTVYKLYYNCDDKKDLICEWDMEHDIAVLSRYGVL